jgi:hypothetical protein
MLCMRAGVYSTQHMQVTHPCKRADLCTLHLARMHAHSTIKPHALQAAPHLIM